jgi:hypothetical protein
MNQRLRELMLEAGYAAPELAGRANKLTELIIADACQALLEWKKEPFPFDESTAVWILKQHFGVE